MTRRFLSVGREGLMAMEAPRARHKIARKGGQTVLRPEVVDIPEPATPDGPPADTQQTPVESEELPHPE